MTSDCGYQLLIFIIAAYTVGFESWKLFCFFFSMYEIFKNNLHGYRMEKHKHHVVMGIRSKYLVLAYFLFAMSFMEDARRLPDVYFFLVLSYKFAKSLISAFGILICLCFLR